MKQQNREPCLLQDSSQLAALLPADVPPRTHWLYKTLLIAWLSCTQAIMSFELSSTHDPSGTILKPESRCTMAQPTIRSPSCSLPPPTTLPEAITAHPLVIHQAQRTWSSLKLSEGDLHECRVLGKHGWGFARGTPLHTAHTSPPRPTNAKNGETHQDPGSAPANIYTQVCPSHHESLFQRSFLCGCLNDTRLPHDVPHLLGAAGV